MFILLLIDNAYERVPVYFTVGFKVFFCFYFVQFE